LAKLSDRPDGTSITPGSPFGLEAEEASTGLQVLSLCPRRTSECQMFKSLKCWLYQCAKGEIPEKSVLYRVFSHEICLYLALRIVQEMPEYEKAEWG
jgi:hypothetical protein